MKILLVFLLTTAAASAAQTEIAEDIRKFTAAIYDEVRSDNNDNILVSPFSVESILALIQSGAVGATGEEIRSSLFLPETKEETESAIKAILPTLVSSEYVLRTANKVYVEVDFDIKEDFKRVAADVYEADFENIEFAENVNAANEINQWVEAETENKIHDLVRPDDLSASTKMVLVNALYFKGNWSWTFNLLYTRKGVFYATNDKTVDAQMMYEKSGYFNFYESEELDAKFLELFFEGGNASMTFILPRENEGIGILEKQMKAALVVPKYTRENVEVSLPKFRIESTTNFKPILEKLGIHRAFDPTEIDLSGIAGSPGDISISKITQKTFIDVHEGGVEAAAATGFIEQPSITPTGDKKFIANHPFAFYIQVHGIVLFEGRVLEPHY